MISPRADAAEGDIEVGMTGIFKDLVVLLRFLCVGACASIYYLLYVCTHSVLLLHSDRFTCDTYTIYLLEWRELLIYHNMIICHGIYSDK